MKPARVPSPFPSVDRVARLPGIAGLMAANGRVAVIDAIRAVLDSRRLLHSGGTEAAAALDEDFFVEVSELLARRATPALRRVFNLTGTVLHTNLGRALLPAAAVAHVAMVMTEACNLEYELESGGRGERDKLVEEILRELTGAEAATVVNNNAAAVLLVLAALAADREVIVSRGELVEIGGSFRIPDVMRSATARLVEVGTTNRTHAADYERAIGPATAALMKVHASNYQISGFVAEVAGSEIAAIAAAHGLPFVMDLGAGSLIDLAAYGLPREPIVRVALAAGADVVTFSGDKLLGGPQAGIIVGKKALVERINRHPLKRALRVSKLTLAALEATLLAYRRPDRLAQELPTLRALTRPVANIAALAERVRPALAAALGPGWAVDLRPVASQVGSGSMPIDTIASVALAIVPVPPASGAAPARLAARLRALPIPVIGRVGEGALLLDLRCLEDEQGFVGQLSCLAGVAKPPRKPPP